MGEREFVMRRKWLIAILVLLLPVGALATIGAGIDLPSWLSDRMDTLRAAVAPRAPAPPPTRHHPQHAHLAAPPPSAAVKLAEG